MDLFAEAPVPEVLPIASGAYCLPGFALALMPMGYLMSVRTSSMGAWGWVSSAQGYGYSAVNPLTGQPWPDIPAVILQLAQTAAAKAGYLNFMPDSCLINVYTPGSKMGLHQDKDEHDFSQPIVSVSLGLPAVFLFGGARRADKTVKITLQHGDVVVWGGKSRRYYHGVTAVKSGHHPLLGMQRINLTLRKAR
jgi:DNA oxidative demethylase